VQDFRADTFSFTYKDDTAKAAAIMQVLDSAKYDAVVIGVHNYSFRPANNYGISPAAWVYGSACNNCLPLRFFSEMCMRPLPFTAKTLVAVHQDDAAFQHTAADFLRGALTAIGRLPVSVSPFKYGSPAWPSTT
jgi:beta-N-acetylhexosaminidase